PDVGTLRVSGPFGVGQRRHAYRVAVRRILRGPDPNGCMKNQGLSDEVHVTLERGMRAESRMLLLLAVAAVAAAACNMPGAPPSTSVAPTNTYTAAPASPTTRWGTPP